MIATKDRIDLHRTTLPTPLSWKGYRAGLREVWSVSLGDGDTFDELEPFSAATPEIQLWGNQRELGFVPIVHVYRWSTCVLWLCAFSRDGGRRSDWRCYWLHGDAYNGLLESGDYRQLPELPPEALRVVLAITTFPITEWPLLAEASPLRRDPVFELAKAFVSWYEANICNTETGTICSGDIDLTPLNDSGEGCNYGLIKWVLDDPDFTEVDCSILEVQGNRYLRFELNPDIAVPFRADALAPFLGALDS